MVAAYKTKFEILSNRIRGESENKNSCFLSRIANEIWLPIRIF